MSLVYFEGKLQQNMYAFQVKMLESGRKNIFRGKNRQGTTHVLDVKVFNER